MNNHEFTKCSLHMHELVNVLLSRLIKREDENMIDQYSQSFVEDVNFRVYGLLVICLSVFQGVVLYNCPLAVS